MTMNTMLPTSLSKTQAERLRKAALRYGFSPDALMRHIIANATEALLAIPEESLSEYENPEEIRNALSKTLRDEREGKILRALPKSITRTRR